MYVLSIIIVLMVARSREETLKAKAEYSRRWRSNNRERHREYSRQYRLEHPWSKEQSQKWVLQRYGLTPELWEVLYQQQNGFCPVCRHGLDRSLPRTAAMGIVVDHHPFRGHVRGLVHSTCNKRVGFVEHAENLDWVVEYIQDREFNGPLKGAKMKVVVNLDEHNAATSVWWKETWEMERAHVKRLIAENEELEQRLELYQDVNRLMGRALECQ